VWALAPISHDASAAPVEGILRAYDANLFDPFATIETALGQ